MSNLDIKKRTVLDTKKKGDLSSWVYPEAKKVDPEILERRRRVAVCWNQLGMSVQKTAESLGVSNTTISKDRQWLLSMWTSLVEADVVEMVSREISKLDAQETELWAAWERSKEDSVEEETERVLNRDTGEYMMVVTKVIRAGRIPEVKYMDGILRCQERRAKLLGLDKAVTFEGATFSFATFVEGAYQATQAQLERAPDPIDVTPVETELISRGDNGEFKATNPRP